MKLKPLFISAPSRSGSSLLTKMLNCTSNMAIVNEPLNSVDIADRGNIEAIFNFIGEGLRYGFMIQRVNTDGVEVTDTFPPSRTKWGKVDRSLDGVQVVGIKKSFPAFSNKDFFKPFIQQWPSFVQWIQQVMGGAVVAIIRDPRFTILSWKTAFAALKESTENQCLAWNTIADAILSSRDLGLKVIRYEDLIKNPTVVVEAIVNHLGIEVKQKEELPVIKPTSIEDFLNRDGLPVRSIETDFRIIEKICGKIAKGFGYAEMIS